MTGTSRRELLYSVSSRGLHLDELEELLVVDHVDLFSATRMPGTPT